MTTFGMWSQLSQGSEIFLALLPAAVIEPSLATLLFTLAGGMFFWIGVRSQRFVLRLVGLLLQFVAVYLFLDAVWYPFRASILLNTYFLNSCSIALISFFSVYCMETAVFSSFKWDTLFFFLLFFVGTVVWYLGGLREIYMHIVVPERLSGVLLFVSATSIFAGIVAEKIHWERLNLVLLLQLPAMLVILFIELVSGPVDYPLFIGWGATVWPVTFFVQYRILAVLDGVKWSKIGGYYHLISLWTLLFVSSREFFLKAVQSPYFSGVSCVVLASFLYIAWFFLVVFMVKKRYWPVSVFPALYLWGGGVGITLIFLGWIVKVMAP